MFRFTNNEKNRRQSLPTDPGRSAVPTESGQSRNLRSGAMQSLEPVRAETAENAQTEQRMAELRAQAGAMMKKYPDFQVKEEMENPVFVEYVFAKGLDMEEAYILTHLDDILEQVRDEAFAELAANRGRMTENGAAKNSPAIASKSPKDFSDAEVDDIIERVRRGEKVKF